MRDKILSAGFLLALLGWFATALYDSIREEIRENNDAINILVGIHLGK